MSATRRCGFTLIEMLIVICICGLLVGMLVPLLRRTWARSRQVKCASNLTQISVAYACHTGDDETARAQPLGGPGWTEKIVKHLNRRDVLICPSGVGLGGGALGVVPGVPGVVVHVWGLYDMPLQEGPLTRMQRNSDGSCLLRFEDVRPDGGDMDFNDLVLRVDELSDGHFRITVVSISAGYHFSLLGPGRTVLIHDLHRHIGENAVVPAEKTSYGINRLVDRLDAGSDRVLILDYACSVADCAGPDATDDWSEWRDADGRLPFARHLGRCNVLFADGSVRPLAPSEMNPDVPELARKYWLPPGNAPTR